MPLPLLAWRPSLCLCQSILSRACFVLRLLLALASIFAGHTFPYHLARVRVMLSLEGLLRKANTSSNLWTTAKIFIVGHLVPVEDGHSDKHDTRRHQTAGNPNEMGSSAAARGSRTPSYLRGALVIVIGLALSDASITLQASSLHRSTMGRAPSAISQRRTLRLRGGEGGDEGSPIADGVRPPRTSLCAWLATDDVGGLRTQVLVRCSSRHAALLSRA
jgi:hypothetical protein